MCKEALNRNSWLGGHFGCINKAKSIMAGAVLAVYMALVPNSNAANLIINPGFESGFAPWTVNTEVGWNVYVESQVPNHSGDHVFKTYGHWDSFENETRLHQEFHASPGNTYTIWYKNSLQDPNWTYLTIVGGDGTTKSVTDTTASGSTRHYRATIQQVAAVASVAAGKLPPPVLFFLANQ